ELRTFIESRALREGMPGADVRADLARRHLSEPVSALLDEQRQWWYDSAPTVALTRHLLNRNQIPDVSIEPVAAQGRSLFRVAPKGWAGTGRLTWTCEVVPASEPDGRVVSFRGGGRERHFHLVVDSHAVDPRGSGPDSDPAIEYRFRSKLRSTISALVKLQYERPGELAYRRSDRLAANVPSVLAAGVTITFAAATGHPDLAIRRTVVTAGEIATNNRLNRYVTSVKLERKHDRALAQLPDRTGIAEGELQRRVDTSHDRASELAATVLGDRAAAIRTRWPDPDVAPASQQVPTSQIKLVRNAVRQEVRQIQRLLTADPIEFLKKIRSRPDGSYRLTMRGDTPGVVVHVEVEYTADPSKINVDYTDGRITLQVPPELGTAPRPELHRAVRDTLTDIAKRQHELTRHEAGARAHLEKATLGAAPSAPFSYNVGEAAREGLGGLQVTSTLAKALAQVLIDRFNGLRSREVADLVERHDFQHWGRLRPAERRSVGNQIGELADNGQFLATAGIDRLADTPRLPAQTPTSAATGHAAAVRAAQEGMIRVNVQHGNPFKLAHVVRDTNGKQTELVYRSSKLGRGYNIEIRISFGTADDGRPVTPGSDRVGRGRFSFTVNVEADPGRITDIVAHVGDNILFDRENRLPNGRWIREDLLPILAQGTSAAGTGVLTNNPALAALAGISALGHGISRQVARLHQLRLNDIAFNKALSEAHNETTTPNHLRRRISGQQQPVEELEQRVREIEERLAADPRTAGPVTNLRNLYGDLPPADQHLLPEVDRLVAALSDLPQNALIATLADAEHTFRLVFTGASGRPENLTFELRTGLGGQVHGIVTGYRVDSDVTFVLQVDPARTPQQIADAVRTWAVLEMRRIAGQPTGLLGAKARWLTFARTVGTQALASAVSLVTADPLKRAEARDRQIAFSGNALTGAGSKELADISYDGNEAVSTQTRTELLRRNISTAVEEHLSVFQAETDALLTRTQWAFDRLQHLEQIAADLPPAERPTPFQHGPRTLPDTPVAWGDDGSATSASDGWSFDPQDLDPTQRPGETPQQAAERVDWAQVAKIFLDLGDHAPMIDITAHDTTHASDGAHSLERHGPDIPMGRDPNTRTVEGRIYGDQPWDGPANYSYRWLSKATMNRVINEYLTVNWTGVREDLALFGVHRKVFSVSNAVGEGYFNRGMYGIGPRNAQHHVTSLVRVTMILVPGSDPARAFIITAFPTGKGD
ncbi:hypothetical protein, partial [Micromonospora sonneratiae]